MTAPLKSPSLYREQGTDALPERPALRAVRCRCGYVAFPPQRRGCEVCGGTGDALSERLLTGRGRLLSQATVHRHAQAAPPVPFTVVEVAMADGPVVRALLASRAVGELSPGTELVTTLETVVIGEQPVRDLRFEPKGA